MKIKLAYKFLYPMIVVFSMFALFNSATSYAAGAAGIAVALDSARAAGKGDAVVADPEDASTVSFNPAGMTKLDGNHLSMGTATIIPLIHYDRSIGLDQDASIKPVYIPSFFAVFSTPIDKLKIGGGVNSPFGLRDKYSSTGDFRYTGIANEVKSVFYTADVAYEVAPWLSVAGGYSYVDVQARQVSKINSQFINNSFGVPGSFEDANTELNLDGNSYAWNVGVMVTLDDNNTLGFCYRSAVRTDLGGDLSVDNIQGGVMQSIFSGSNFNTSANTESIFPDMAVIGWNHKFDDKLSAEVDFGWTGWGKFDHFDFDFGAPNAVINGLDPYENKFRNTISVNTGLSYKLDSKWTLLGGYYYWQRAALKTDYSNLIPDGDRHAATIGVQYKVTNNVAVAASYEAHFFAPVKIDNNVGSGNNASVDGEYSTLFHIVTVGITYKFG